VDWELDHAQAWLVVLEVVHMEELDLLHTEQALPEVLEIVQGDHLDQPALLRIDQALLEVLLHIAQGHLHIDQPDLQTDQGDHTV
jgi:hypothetical protein